MHIMAKKWTHLKSAMKFCFHFHQVSVFIYLFTKFGLSN